jgi:hypothetical protein
MGCHLGWHCPVGCPPRAVEENIKTIGTSNPRKTIRKNKFFAIS